MECVATFERRVDIGRKHREGRRRRMTDGSTRVGAPTGSGKTTVFELAILSALRGRGNVDVRGGRAAKVIYLAPARALIAEKAAEWRERLGRVGLTFAVLTGDTDARVDIWGEIENCDVILATPEKFDRVTRLDANRGGMSFFSDVSLVLIDEVHLIGDDRGGCLEAIVSRLKLLSKSPALVYSHLRNVRFGAVSATIPNIQDLGDWLGAKRGGVFVFGDEFRPVKLQTFVRSFRDSSNDFLFHKYLKDHVFPVVMEFYRGKQTLVFCGARDSAMQTAKQLVLASKSRGDVFFNYKHGQTLYEAAAQVKNKNLSECITAGVAFHHAGLEHEDRTLVENLFKDRIITVLCSTTTLAVGVNLPAYLCIVCGTSVYDGGGAYKEVSMDTLLQMVGRAGRPQFDTEGVAVVMTKNSLRARYEGLVHGKVPLQSTLGSSLPEYLNAEISCRTVNSMQDAVEWVKSTYYFIRMCSEPLRYGIKHGESIDDAVVRIVNMNIQKLTSSGMCASGASDSSILQPLKAGDIMSLRYLRFETMKGIMAAASTSTYAELLKMLCESSEFKDTKLRRDEKKPLKELNHESGVIRYPIQEVSAKAKKLSTAKVIRTATEKLFLVAQYMMTDALEPKTGLLPSMRMEGDKIFSVGSRIMRAASAYFQSTLVYSSAVNSFSLAKGLDMRSWPDSKVQCTQLKHVRTKKMTQKLLGANMGEIAKLEAADPRVIEMVLEKAFPFGNTLQGDVKDLPSPLEISITHQAVSKQSYNVDVEVKFRNASGSRMNMNHLPMKYQGTLFVGTEHDDRLVYTQRLPHRELDLDGGSDPSSLVVFHGRFNCSNVPSGSLPLCFNASIIFERCIGRDVHTAYTIHRGSNGSPMTPGQTGKHAGSLSSTPTWKQTTIDTKRFKLTADDDKARRNLTFDDNPRVANATDRKKSSTHTEDVCNRCGKKGHWARDCSLPDQRPEEERGVAKPNHSCRRCGELGHYAKNCPQDLEGKCRLCLCEGHFARDCPKKDQLESPSAPSAGDETDWSFAFD